MTTSCDEGVAAEEEKRDVGGGANRSFNMECNGFDATEYMQSARNMGCGNYVDYGGGDSANEGDGRGETAGNGGSEEMDLFSAINPLDMTGTQHFTPQNTNSLGQVILSADEKVRTRWQEAFTSLQSSARGSGKYLCLFFAYSLSNWEMFVVGQVVSEYMDVH